MESRYIADHIQLVPGMKDVFTNAVGGVANICTQVIDDQYCCGDLILSTDTTEPTRYRIYCEQCGTEYQLYREHELSEEFQVDSAKITESEQLSEVPPESESTQSNELPPETQTETVGEDIRIQKGDISQWTAEQKAALIDLGFFDVPKKQRDVIAYTLSGCYVYYENSNDAFFAFRPFGTINGKPIKRLPKYAVRSLLKKQHLIRAEYQMLSDADGEYQVISDTEDDCPVLYTDRFSIEALDELTKRQQEREQEQKKEALYEEYAMKTGTFSQLMRATQQASVTQQITAYLNAEVITHEDSTLRTEWNPQYATYMSIYEEFAENSPFKPPLGNPRIRINFGEAQETDTLSVNTMEFSGGLTFVGDNVSSRLLKTAMVLSSQEATQFIEQIVNDAVRPAVTFNAYRMDLFKAFAQKQDMSLLTVCCEKIDAFIENYTQNTTDTE